MSVMRIPRRRACGGRLRIVIVVAYSVFRIRGSAGSVGKTLPALFVLVRPAPRRPKVAAYGIGDQTAAVLHKLAGRPSFVVSAGEAADYGGTTAAITI